MVSALTYDRSLSLLKPKLTRGTLAHAANHVDQEPRSGDIGLLESQLPDPDWTEIPGDHFVEPAYVNLTRDQELELIGRYHGRLTSPGEKSSIVSFLLSSQIINIKRIAKSMMAKKSEYVETYDLIMSGCEGLLISLEKFDVSSGYRLSTYSSYWIRNRMEDHIRSFRWFMGVPERTYKNMLKASVISSEHYNIHGEHIDDAELARILGRDVSYVRSIRLWEQRDVASIEMIESENNDISLDSIITTRHSLYEQYEDLHKPYALEILRDVFSRMIEKLDEAEVSVVTLYFDFSADSTRSHSEIARTLGISAERSRQILTKALKKLRGDLEYQATLDDLARTLLDFHGPVESRSTPSRTTTRSHPEDSSVRSE